MSIQLPNFVDQYQKRVDAHLIEVTTSLKGFQAIADQFHSGSIEKLIHKHEVSLDSTFRQEAKPIRDVYDRKKRFESERVAINTNLWLAAWHVWWAGDPDLYNETMQNYSASILLNQNAMVFALIFSLGLVLLFDLLLRLIAYLVIPKKHSLR